jgi:Na+-driven multidrug efflux pump
LVRAFSKDPDVIKIGVDFIIAVGLLRPFLGLQIIYLTLFQALGKSRQAAILAIGRQGLFLVAAILTLPGFFSKNIGSLSLLTNILPYKLQSGLYGVLYSQFVSDALAIILTIAFALHLKKELLKKVTE